MDEVIEEIAMLAILGVGAYLAYRYIKNILPSGSQAGSDVTNAIGNAIGNAVKDVGGYALDATGSAADATLNYLTAPTPTNDWFTSSADFVGNLLQTTGQGLFSALYPASDIFTLSGGTHLSNAPANTGSTGGGGGW